MAGLAVVLLTLLGASVSGAVAGVVSRPGAPGKLRVQGLSKKERQAIDIVSVRAVSDDSFGLLVTVQFKGDVQDRLGQGHLKHGLVALVLKPKAAGATPSGVIDEGGGSFREL